MSNQLDISLTHPHVLVVVTHWNDEETTTECLKYVERLDYKEREVVVVDSGSTDGSGERLRSKFPWAKLATLMVNAGHARAANVGVSMSRESLPKYILFLDNDALVEPSCLRVLVECLDNRPRAAMAAPLILSGKKPGRIWYAGGGITIFGNSRHEQFGKELGRSSLGGKEVRFAPSCTLLVRRDVFEQLGGFDELLVNYSEDLVLSIRVNQQGYTILFEPAARVTHGESKNVVKVAGKSFRDYYTMRNRLYVIWKYGTRFQKTVGLSCTALWYGVTYGLAFAVRGEWKRTEALMLGVSDFVSGRMGWRSL